MTTGIVNQVAVRNMRKTRDVLRSRGPYQVGAAAIRESYMQVTRADRQDSRDGGPNDNRQISRPQMYFLARQRETIARTLEPTRELDSRNVSGPLTDHRPCCRDHTLSSRSLGFMSMQLTQSMEVSILNILSIHTWTWLLLFSFTHFCSNLQFFPPPHIGKSALLSNFVV